MTGSTFPTHLQPVMRAMQLPDLDLVMEIEKQSFPTPWPRSIYAREATTDSIGRYFVVAPTKESTSTPSILGYGGMWLLDTEAHITTIAIHPQWRRRKIGMWLLLQLIQYARQQGVGQVSLEVREHNMAAIGLYEKLGFVAVGIRPRYYRDNGEDALIYTLFGLNKEKTTHMLDGQLAHLISQSPS